MIGNARRAALDNIVESDSDSISEATLDTIIELTQEDHTDTRQIFDESSD